MRRCHNKTPSINSSHIRKYSLLKSVVIKTKKEFKIGVLRVYNQVSIAESMRVIAGMFMSPQSPTTAAELAINIFLYIGHNCSIKEGE